MFALKKTAIIALGAVTTGLYLAAPAGADPDPCGGVAFIVCRMVPVMPDLEHDVDLTQDPNGLIDGQDGQSPGVQPGASQSPGVQPGADHSAGVQPGADHSGG